MKEFINCVIAIILILLVTTPIVMIFLMLLMIITIVPLALFIIVPAPAKFCILIGLYISSIALIYTKRIAMEKQAITK